MVAVSPTFCGLSGGEVGADIDKEALVATPCYSAQHQGSGDMREWGVPPSPPTIILPPSQVKDFCFTNSLCLPWRALHFDDVCTFFFNVNELNYHL